MTSPAHEAGCIFCGTQEQTLTNPSRVSCIYDRRQPDGTPSQSSKPRSASIQPRPPTGTATPARKHSPLLEEYRIPHYTGLGSHTFDQSNINHFPIDSFTLPESQERRLIEMRLLQNFITSTSHTLPASHDPSVLETWSTDVPQLSFEYDNLLYPILAISALELLISDPHNQDLITARHNYTTLSLQEHRRAIAGLTDMTACAACFASTLILIDAFASLQHRLLEPYTPPREWLQMSRGAGSVFGAAIGAINEISRAKVTAVVLVEPVIQNADVEFRRPYLGLLRQDVPTDEAWDDETRDAYEKTLDYIGSVKAAIESGEHPMGVARRIMAFALLAPRRFIEAVEQQRPRALAVLAHFFALGSVLQDVWWLGNTVQREIQGIWIALPLEWKYMVSPLVGEGKKIDYRFR